MITGLRSPSVWLPSEMLFHAKLSPSLNCNLTPLPFSHSSPLRYSQYIYIFFLFKTLAVDVKEHSICHPPPPLLFFVYQSEYSRQQTGSEKFAATLPL